MKRFFTLLFMSVLTIGAAFAQPSSVSATYSAGNINTNSYYYSSTCNANDTLQLSVPAGSLITGVDVQYNMTAQSWGWMSEQRSQIECITTGNTEGTWFAGSGYYGTFSYARTGLDIANGISNGSVTFRMQAWRTYGYGGCTSTYQVIPNNSWSVTVYYCPGTAPFTPILSVDTVLANCGDSSATVSANSSYTSYLWSNGDTNVTASFSTSGEYVVLASDANGCPYPDTVHVSVITTNPTQSDSSICQGEEVTLDGQFVPYGGCIAIDTFMQSNYQLIDHNSITGDDRGGIAITPDYFYYVGDGATGRMDASNLANAVALPQRDGIFSDLNSGQLWTFWSGSSFNYSNITSIAKMDVDLNIGDVTPLSQSINAGYGSFVAAGSGYVILWANNNDTFYHIDLTTGEVTNLGSGNISTSSNIYFYNTENWSRWGVAECDSTGGYAIVGRAYYINSSYMYSPGVIARYYISSGDKEIVTTFSGSVSDMACITYSPWNDRWYFHWEGYGSTFPVFGSEMAGYADAQGTGGAGVMSPPPSYIYAWNTGDTAQILTAMPDSTMDFVLMTTDGIGMCYDTLNVQVTEAPSISLTSTDIACKGDSNGAVSSSVSGGSSPYTYSWWPMDTNIANGYGSGTGVSNVPAGTYYLSVVDDNGCSNMDTAEVTEPLSLFIPILSGLADPLCSYSEDGEALVLPAGGDAPYTYNWSNGETTVGNTTLGDGNFSVTATDANGCERVMSGTLTSPDPVSMSFAATGNDCEADEDGTATVTASGGTAPYAYAWENGDDDPNANGLPSGFQNLTITDDNGCMFSDSVEITFLNTAPEITLADSFEKCTEWSITLDAGPNGASYAWSTGDTSQTTTTNAGGLIFVTVTGANGCVTEKSTFVVNNPCPTGIEAVGDVPSINVYPNPSNGVFNVEVEGNVEEMIDLQVLDLTGRVMTSEAGALGSGSNITTLNLSGLARGTYMLRMSQKGELISVRNIVIQ